MSIIYRASRNISFKFPGELISRALAVIFIIYMARKLGDDDFGKYSFAYTFAFIFAIFIDMGLNTLIVRDVARNKKEASRYIPNIAGIKILLSVFTSKYFEKLHLFRKISKSLLSCIVMSVIVFLSLRLNLAIIITLCALSYAAFLIILKEISREEVFMCLC